MTHELWAKLNRHMYEYLQSVTMNSLVMQQRARVAPVKALHKESRMRHVPRAALLA